MADVDVCSGVILGVKVDLCTVLTGVVKLSDIVAFVGFEVAVLLVRRFPSDSASDAVVESMYGSMCAILQKMVLLVGKVVGRVGVAALEIVGVVLIYGGKQRQNNVLDPARSFHRYVAASGPFAFYRFFSLGVCLISIFAYSDSIAQG